LLDLLSDNRRSVSIGYILAFWDVEIQNI